MSLKRTVVIGTSCSGKTTFAKRLAQSLDIQHIELDAINWLPNWTPRSNDEFRILVEKEVSADKWVVDGNYSKTRDIVWSRATVLIWLNYSFPVVLSRAFSRTISRIFDREILFSGNRETFRMAFLSRDSILLWVLQTYYRRRREYARLLNKLQGRDVEIRVFCTPEETERFLSGVEKENYNFESQSQDRKIRK
jgi:adenylate kinase family enzyme